MPSNGLRQTSVQSMTTNGSRTVLDEICAGVTRCEAGNRGDYGKLALGFLVHQSFATSLTPEAGPGCGCPLVDLSLRGARGRRARESVGLLCDPYHGIQFTRCLGPLSRRCEWAPQYGRLYMGTPNFELSDYELSCEELDAVSGGACDLSDVVALSGGPLEREWVKMGCPVPKSK